MGGGSSTFGAKTTAEEVATTFSAQAKGKHFIITGGSGGLGLETARVLCKEGGIVTVTVRTEQQGNAVLQKIKQEQGEDAQIFFGLMTLDDLTTIKAFAKSYIDSGKPLNVLINNAGVMANPYSETKQGFESQLGVNHIGHFYLTKLLLPLLKRSGTPESKSRVVSVASLAQYLYAPPSGIIWDDLNAKQGYDKWQRYGQSKLANILFAKELNKRCADEGDNVIAVALHPGAIMESDLMRHNSLLQTLVDNVVINWREPGKIWNILSTAYKNIAQGAATTVVCALDTNISPGMWYIDCNETLNDLHPLANDAATAARLWDVTEELVKPYL